jgi:hypothetical protein
MMNTLWWSPIGMSHVKWCADVRYHDEYGYLIDSEFLTWTNPTGAEPVPSEFGRDTFHRGSANIQNPP